MSNQQVFRPTQIITAHTNADFDALAAMVAAKKLYPEATLIAPNFLAREEKHAFLNEIPERFHFILPKDCDFSEVSLVVIVDTRNASRVAHIKKALDNPGVAIHLYDHHPNSPNDLQGDVCIVKDWGSTTAILTEIIRNQKILLSPDEATMLALGVYEDTGAFTFNSTTPHDLYAVAYFLECGMDLSVIKDLMARDLTRQQVHVLDELLSNAVTHNINGIPITIVDISMDNYLGDFASIVTRLIEMEKLKVVFALAEMGDRIHMVARSSLSEINVGKICQAFGGGGHHEAAAASIKNTTLVQAKGELLTLLVTTIRSEITVGSHMTSPAKTIDEDMTMAEADEVMMRYGLKAVPVVKKGSLHCKGILELQTASRATSHKLGDLLVGEYMQRSFNTLPPEADLHLAIEIILAQRQRLIPVVKDHNVIGVLTRTDILRIVVDETLRIPEGTPHLQEHQEKSILPIMKTMIPPDIFSIFKIAGELGDLLSVQVFSVGGFVRDLLMKQKNLDIDLSVEGDGITYSNALAVRLNGTVRHHPKFKTAIILYKNAAGEKCRIDVATARMEYYEKPAALPSVELSSIKMDLFRRDFTINALAIQLNPERFGVLIDPFGGQKDIKSKNIAVLHSLSFIEDPTRIMRAVRFEQRFGFKINAQTERLIKNCMSLDIVGRLSGVRLFNEMKHVFDEKTAKECIERLEGWGFWKLINPQLALTPSKKDLISSINEVLGWYKLLYKETPQKNWVLFLLALCKNIKHTELSIILSHLGFIESEKKYFLHLRGVTHKASTALIARAKNADISLSSLYEILSRIPLEGLLYLMADYGEEYSIGEDVSLYLTKIKDVKADINGDDLVAMGYPRGPILGKLLHLILLAKLNGVAVNKEAQMLVAQTFLPFCKEKDFKFEPTLHDLLETLKDTIERITGNESK